MNMPGCQQAGMPTGERAVGRLAEGRMGHRQGEEAVVGISSVSWQPPWVLLKPRRDLGIRLSSGWRIALTIVAVQEIADRHAAALAVRSAPSWETVARDLSRLAAA